MIRSRQECYNVDGGVKPVDNIDVAHERVTFHYPGAIRQGSVGHWGWKMDWDDTDSEILAEAWPRRGCFGWNLRIKRKSRV